LPYAEKHLCKVFYYKIMKKLSVEDSRKLVNSFVKSYGQRGAAQKLTEIGYMSPEGAQILQAHIFRIINGSGTCLLAPETENQQQQKTTTKEPIAAAVPPKRRKEIESIIANEELLKKEIAETSQEIHDELLEEEVALQEMERTQPALVPCTESRPYREARHLEKDIRISAVFNRRQPVEFKTDDEGHEECYFGIPRMKHSSTTTCRPHQTRQYGRNTLSTRDLSVHQKQGPLKSILEIIKLGLNKLALIDLQNLRFRAMGLQPEATIWIPPGLSLHPTVTFDIPDLVALDSQISERPF
jgi:hypothetical protein